MFNPKEIIFCPTDACNLKCPHCFVEKGKNQLDVNLAKSFLELAIPSIERIGFSGGEPFLYLDFLTELSKKAVEMDLLFDQVMTNGDWWKSKNDLEESLLKLFDSGYDGKIGLSWDAFHNQKTQRIEIFVESVQKIFGNDSLNIQSVKYEPKKAGKVFTENENKGKTSFFCDEEKVQLKESKKEFPPKEFPPKNFPPKDFIKKHPEIPVFYLPQTFSSEDCRAWKSWRWFKEDYCEGPGQVLYVHSNGNIAPCCGFANENEALFIGKLSDGFEKVMQNAMQNKMIKICYETGLSEYRRQLQKKLKSEGKKLPGKCGDICSFCDYVCKNF